MYVPRGSKPHKLKFRDALVDECVPIAAVRVYNKRPLHYVAVKKIGRLAVLQEWRGCGIGWQLMQSVEQMLLAYGDTATIYLHAQSERVKFYE